MTDNNKGRKKKADSLALRNYAFVLYCQNIDQNDIATRVDVSPQTISEWKKKDSWEIKRASKTVSMDELIVKALKRINDLLDAKDFNADAFSKSVAQLKALKQRNTVDDEVNCFLDFQNFLLNIRHREGIDEEFIKRLVKFQDMYIQTKTGNV